MAQAERDARDPVKRAQAIRESKIDDALDQWSSGLKLKSDPTRSAYATFKRVLLDWTASKHYEVLSDVTADALDAWVASWSPDAERKENKLKANTQKFRVARIRSFFEWAYRIQKIPTNPAVTLRTIRITKEDTEETQPLTHTQFEEVMAATHKCKEFGAEFRAIFQLQRWLGVRLVDALMLSRSGVQGNRIILTTQKTGDAIDRIVPDSVVDALAAVPKRKTMHPDHYFWSRKCSHRALSTLWTPRIKQLNEHLNFKDENGEPMRFRSHMLRDTYAVELLLAGMPLDKVSKLLTHSSIRTTERHYAKWVKAREDQLERETIEAMRKMGAKFDGD